MHYCVTNMPGAVARTSTVALNNATLPFTLQLAEKGLARGCAENPHLARGLNVHQGTSPTRPWRRRWASRCCLRIAPWPEGHHRMGLLWTILIGFLAGVVAKFLFPGRPGGGFIVTTILGILGAVVATYLGQALGLYHAQVRASSVRSLARSSWPWPWFQGLRPRLTPGTRVRVLSMFVAHSGHESPWTTSVAEAPVSGRSWSTIEAVEGAPDWQPAIEKTRERTGRTTGATGPVGPEVVDWGMVHLKMEGCPRRKRAARTCEWVSQQRLLGNDFAVGAPHTERAMAAEIGSRERRSPLVAR